MTYAKPQDLPSFPSSGGRSNAAGAAALLAQDYRVKDQWKPETSTTGSQAAVRAQKDGADVPLWQPTTSQNGLSAATLAMRKKDKSPVTPNIDRGFTETGKSNSLLAATQSASKGRTRADSTPVPAPPRYPDSRNSASNALSAATISHRASIRGAPPPHSGWSSEANQAARITHSHMDASMFGSHPVVGQEVGEQKHEAALRASAVSMAKKIYDQQNRASVASDSTNIGSAGAETAHRRNASSPPQTDVKQEAIKFLHLQDAAQKLAQERLAKVDKEMENNGYLEYYGYGDKDRSHRRSHLSMRGRDSKRAASEGTDRDPDDEQQARHIRKQMSQLSSGLNTVDGKQRSEDRARVLKAAEKRVHDRMHDMDEKVFKDTGKPSQAMMEEWEAKARAKAEKDHAEREKHTGRTHIGGGKYMDTAEIEAIAAARLKPMLDEINVTAEQKRERDRELKRQQDLEETERMGQRMKQDGQKTEFKRIRGKHAPPIQPLHGRELD